MNEEEYVTAIHKSTWEELDKKVQSKYGKSIAQLFGKDTQILEHALSNLITEMIQREIFSEDIKYDLVKVYTEMKIGNLWDKSLNELKEHYQTAMFGITLLTLLSMGDFYVTVMWNLIEFLLKAKEN
jgi:hypothetical protein